MIIALVENNKCHFPLLEQFASGLLYTEYNELNEPDRKSTKQKINDYLWSVIEPHVKFLDVAEDLDVLTLGCQHLTACFPDKNPDEFFYHTEGSYTCPKKFLEIMYCQELGGGSASGEKMNHLACLFSLKHTVIENNCIIFANDYDLASNCYTRMTSITKEDIIRAIRRRFFFSAVVIKDDTLSKYYYQNPSYLLNKVYGLGGNDQIQKLCFENFQYNMLFYFQQDIKTYINKIATRLNGLYRIYGDVVLLNELEENIFTNISIHEVQRLNVLSYGRVYDRQLKPEEIPVAEVGGQKVPLWSKYIVVNCRMVGWKRKKNKCLYCLKEMENIVTCDKCYRMKCCSDQCLVDLHHDCIEN